MSARFLFFVFSLCFTILVNAGAQDLPPKTTWEGKLGAIRLILRINEDSVSHKPTAVFDSPDQGALGLTVSKLHIAADSLEAFSSLIQGGFKGSFNADKSVLNGIWQQGGATIPLILKRTANREGPKRPQNPKPPFPYKAEDLIYSNKDKTIQYGATLTLPVSTSPSPVVILITGSGQEDRDETVFGHKPFLVIADHLSRNGIAVLRVDDRGVGKTTGDAKNATSEDFAQDVLAGIAYLKTRKEIDPARIGLIGHSEGGIIAPMVALRSKDVSFIVSLAGVGVTGKELIKRQVEHSYTRMGFDQEGVKRILDMMDVLIKLSDEYPDEAKLKSEFKPAFQKWLDQQPEDFLRKAGFKGPDADKAIGMMANRTYSPWMRYFFKYDPATTLTKVKIPVLAMNGEKDTQVSAKENLEGFRKYLTQAGNKDFKIALLPGLNHLFQTADTGEVGEYADIEETFAPEALKVMTDWIRGHSEK
ncbi:hypothetical protein BDE36_3340 [Arcticibacter tournemirensis]|uniref:Alpha/beta hydrolase n=1 Tax=Arcticibacter tournemirensis TaxID=699437 RepID=A0A5M9GZ50_9SPHI|nr:alpha/beta hydrolase [Arcticibacter tournemirensis]KAA8479973.1 alpha/beta hydrolase [Arcticibacter tournemirensis]TQM51561.1 hypothetical protein BDE36_3340 [Arcticibacter tournemirensis]